jgi:hypothetical protein
MHWKNDIVQLYVKFSKNTLPKRHIHIFNATIINVQFFLEYQPKSMRGVDYKYHIFRTCWELTKFNYTYMYIFYDKCPNVSKNWQKVTCKSSKHAAISVVSGEGLRLPSRTSAISVCFVKKLLEF